MSRAPSNISTRSLRGGDSALNRSISSQSSGLSRLQRPTASAAARKISSSTTSSSSTTTSTSRSGSQPRSTTTTSTSVKRRIAEATSTPSARPSLTATKRARMDENANPNVGGASASASNASGGKKKRPAWDIKGRLEDLERFTITLKQQVKESNSQVEALQQQVGEKESQLHEVAEVKTVLEKNVEVRQREFEEAQRGITELRSLLESTRQSHRSEMAEKERLYNSLQSEHSNLLIKLDVRQEELDRAKMQIAKAELEMEGLRTQIVEMQQTLEERKRTISEQAGTISDQTETIAAQKARIEELEYKSREHEQLRRKLHNTIQELKGNIRVFCRVRPLIGAEAEDEENAESPFAFPENCDEKELEVSQSGRESVVGGKAGPSKKFRFQFDKVFRPEATQVEVFEEISQLVQSALDGYNTCIFTYGQTGSGKTFTMEGPGMQEMGLVGEDMEKRGMIPRTVEQIFETTRYLQEKGWEYTMEAAFLEIYNEEIRDLLKKKKAKAAGSSSSANQKKDKEAKKDKYEIKHDAKGNTTVTNLTTVTVEQPYQVYDLLKRAAHNRAVASTKLNERSSRSHSVFQLKLSGLNKINGKTTVGILNLIDLAGSERLANSGATGDRLTETKNINRSLSCLGDVIYSLATKGQHIPYRNSKLTYLLQNCLGGNSKTLMFVNISPLARDVNESLSSLRFATKVNSCDIGTAKRNIK
ncbi:kinesin-like nuclear fusion protein [Balamuthia mandrillaris]